MALKENFNPNNTLAAESHTALGHNAVATEVNRLTDLLSEFVSPDKAVGKAATQTLTNKTLTAPAIDFPTITLGNNTALNSLDNGAQIRELIKVTAGNVATFGDTNNTTKIKAGGATTNGHTVPNIADDTVALLAALQTLTNKTLTTPTIASLVNANHNHQNSAGGGLLDLALISTSAWTSFTPAYTNLTVGSGTNQGYYIKIGKLVVVKTKFIMAADSSMGTGPLLTLPVTAASQAYTANNSPIGIANILDSGTANFNGSVSWASTTTGLIIVYDVSATYLKNAGITASVPMVWTTNDELDLFLTYEAA